MLFAAIESNLVEAGYKLLVVPDWSYISIIPAKRLCKGNGYVWHSKSTRHKERSCNRSDFRWTPRAASGYVCNMETCVKPVSL